MSAVDKFSVPNRDNLMQLIQLDIPQKLKTFSEFFLQFSKSSLNFEHFPKKPVAHSFFICGATACEKGFYIYVQKSRFRLPFQKEHGKRVSTLFKSERERLWHIYCSTGRQFSGQKSLLVI